MRQQLESRLKTLRAEYQAGKRELAELENRQTVIRQTLERLRAAIEQIEEQQKKQP